MATRRRDRSCSGDWYSEQRKETRGIDLREPFIHPKPKKKMWRLLYSFVPLKSWISDSVVDPRGALIGAKQVDISQTRTE